jgi:hypothetical protein
MVKKTAVKYFIQICLPVIEDKLRALRSHCVQCATGMTWKRRGHQCSRFYILSKFRSTQGIRTHVLRRVGVSDSGQMASKPVMLQLSTLSYFVPLCFLQFSLIFPVILCSKTYISSFPLWNIKAKEQTKNKFSINIVFSPDIYSLRRLFQTLHKSNKKI